MSLSDAAAPVRAAPVPVRFYYRGQIQQVEAAGPTRTVLEWLREDAHRTGTKEGCAEGDCGACTVVVGELDAAGALQLASVNACIRFLPTLHGKALFTVEDVAIADGRLHPVQQAMVEQHASQCGFCTPGFVMSLWACYQRHQAVDTVPTRQQLAHELSGNLCRCTGYRPILDAGLRMFELPPVRLALEPVLSALRALADEPPVQQTSFQAPRSVPALAAALLEQPQARLLAGGTDIGLWVTKQQRVLGPLIYLGDVAGLRDIHIKPELITLGAGASLEDAWQALVQIWPTLRDLWLRFASPPVRHAGTLGGNVVNGSPIGDAAPVLMALDARLLLQRGEVQRRLPLHDFYTGYQRNRLQPGEFLCALEVPRCPQTQVQAYKISKRYDSDISAVCAGLAIRLQDEVVAEVRLAYGGMAATVARARGAEAALLGQRWDAAALDAAVLALATDFTPLTDQRASAAYRLQVAGNLLRRFWLQTRVQDPLPEAAVSVWARSETA